MRTARARALRKSIIELLNDAMASATGITADYIDEAKELVEVLYGDVDEDEPTELRF